MTKPNTESRRGFIRRNLVNLLIILIALGGVGLLAKFLPKKQTESKPLPPKPVPVTVMTVEVLPTYQDRVKIAGRTEPNRITRLSAELAASIERYAHLGEVRSNSCTIPPAPKTTKLDEGFLVKAGQPILYLNTDYTIATLEQARADYDFALIDYKRVSELRGSGVSTAQELDLARTRRDKAKSALTRAEADMKRCVIVAPSPGELNRLPIEEREYVQKGDVVAEIVDLSIIKVSLDVAERDSPFLKKGQALTLSYGLVQPRTLHGTITYISAIAEPSTQTTHIEVSIPNPDRSIRPSQITKTYLPLRKLENVIMIPLAVAIPLPGKTSLEKGHRIWLLENGKGVPREVKLDMDMLRGELVRVAEGLVGGETLITAGRNYIGPNQPVKVINTIPTPRP